MNNEDKKLLTTTAVMAALLIISLFMMAGGLSRTLISGTKNDKGRVEIKITDYSIIFIPGGTLSFAPITNARYYTDSTAEKTLISYVIIYTTKEEFKFDGKRADYSDEEKRNFFNNLDFFLSDPEQKEFKKTFSKVGFTGITGVIFFAVSLFYIIPKRKKIIQTITSEAKKIDFQKLIKEFKQKTGKSKSTVKKETKPAKSKEPKVYELEPDVSRTLRVLIPAFIGNLKYDINTYKLPETDEIMLACTSNQKTEFEQKYGNQCKYLICDDAKNITDMLPKAAGWLKDFIGYLFIQTSDLPEPAKPVVTKMFKDHRDKDCACTFLSKETYDRKISTGKLIRSVANKIIKISEYEEQASPSEQTSEVYAGLFCFNTKNLIKEFDKISSKGSGQAVPLTRIVELYYKNGYRVNSYKLSAQGAPPVQPVSSSDQFRKRPEEEVKSTALIILAVENPSADVAKRVYDKAASGNNFEKVCVITDRNSADEFTAQFGDYAEIFYSEPGLGDGYDVLNAENTFKGYKGNILLIPENNSEISSEQITQLITEHYRKDNTCTYLTLPENNILCCVSSDYFMYAAKRIIKDDETKKYYLSQITSILVNDKKRVQDINS